MTQHSSLHSFHLIVGFADVRAKGSGTTKLAVAKVLGMWIKSHGCGKRWKDAFFEALGGASA
ncbi:hypothetical protein Hanom_Chr10g00943131 [Helianthus anomalus]